MFVDRGAKHQESWLLRRTIKKWPTFSSSTKVVISLLFSSSFLFSTAYFQAKHGRDKGLGCQDWNEYKRILQLSDSPHIFIDGLSASTSEEEVRDMLEQAGKVIKVTLRPSISHEGCKCGYASYEDAPSARLGLFKLSTKQVEGRRLAARLVESLEEEVRVFDVLS